MQGKHYIDRLIIVQTKQNKLTPFFSRLKFSQTTTKIASKQTPSEVNQTSGGVTIVKLNSSTANNISKPSQTAAAVAPSALRNAPPSTTPITVNNAIITNVAANDANPVSGPKIVASQTTGVTIHTSSNTTSNTNSNVNTNANAALPVNQTQHTGYTRRAKFGDSRSTGRLHSAGNTHRSMTRLNIAGMHFVRKIRFISTAVMFIVGTLR